MLGLDPSINRAPWSVEELVRLKQVRPLHEVVKIDYFLPGCPPPAERIRAALEPLLRGELPQLSGSDQIRFG